MLYEKLLIKLTETFEKGVGAHFRPKQIIREGKARAEVLKIERRAIAEAEVEAEEIRQGRKSLINGELIALPAPDSKTDEGGGPEEEIMMSLMSAAQSEADYLAVKRAINLRKIALLAQEEATETPDEEVSDEPVDPDWFARWRDGAQDVRNEEMQQIWAKLLKGEVKNPGGFSLQAVSLLRNLGPKQANWIAALGPFVINQNFIAKDCRDLLDEAGGTLEILLELESLGVLTGIVGNVTFCPHFRPDPEDGSMAAVAFPISNIGIFIRHKAPPPPLEIPIFSILKAGSELISLGQFDPNQDYLMKFAKILGDKKFETFFVDMIPGEPGIMDVSTRRPIEF